MPSHPAPLVIGIAGGSGSGKTTVAQVILQRVGPERIAFLQHDSYYKDLGGLPPAQRAEVNFDHPNSLETELLIRHIEQLRRGRAVDVPIYDFATHSRTERTLSVMPNGPNSESAKRMPNFHPSISKPPAMPMKKMRL